jgi:hypothetical protein
MNKGEFVLQQLGASVPTAQIADIWLEQTGAHRIAETIVFIEFLRLLN